MPEAVAQFDHSVFHVAGLPRVHKVVRGRQGIHVSRARGVVVGGMRARSGVRQRRAENCQKEKTNGAPQAHVTAVPRFVGSMTQPITLPESMEDEEAGARTELQIPSFARDDNSHSDELPEELALYNTPNIGKQGLLCWILLRIRSCYDFCSPMRYRTS